MIPLDQCEHGYLYGIRARNIRMGVYNEKLRGFIGIREKFGNRFLDGELHREASKSFGTATPTEKLEACPVADLRTTLDLICEKCRQPMHHEGKIGSITHVHDQATDCTEPWGVLGFNKLLFDYLDEAEKRFGEQ